MATLKSVDAVLVGFGWTGGIIANELTKAGLSVVALERGEFRDTNPDFVAYSRYDELAYAIQYKMMQDTSKETLTFRNERSQTALPMRQLGSFLPGDGVGGAGVHWNGATWRFLPADLTIRSRYTQKYGAAIFGENCTSADWGVTYDELEPYFDRFEYLAGIAGKAGNLRGQTQPGGNPFEGPRQREYPNPPMIASTIGATFAQAVQNLGYNPFPQPSANSTRRYTNPEGVTLGECIYCGYCERFGCETGAKASLQTTLWPKVSKNANFELRTHAKVLKVNLDSTGKKAVSVTYLDSLGREQVQPANMIFLTAYGLNNVHLLLLSKIGQPYDPATGNGVVGKNYAYQAGTNTQLFFNSGKYFNAFMGAGSQSICIDDFNSDNFDHSGKDFVAGGLISASSSGFRPILYHPVPKGTPRWGAAWKKAVAHYYNRSFTIGSQASVQSYRGNYLDLDPTYKDVYGQPLLRMTFDYGPHEHKAAEMIAGVQERIARAAGATTFTTNQLSAHYNIVPYQSTHNTGGAIMGTDPAKSVVNKYMQTWDVPNVFVMGACAFPQNAGYNPTGTIGALTYLSADAVVKRYVKNPGPLA